MATQARRDLVRGALAGLVGGAVAVVAKHDAGGSWLPLLWVPPLVAAVIAPAAAIRSAGMRRARRAGQERRRARGEPVEESALCADLWRRSPVATFLVIALLVAVFVAVAWVRLRD